jgi:hypothetical protein
MSTTPPEQPTTPQQPAGGYGSQGPNINLNLGALMPTPGNAELAVYVIATLVVTIVALVDDVVNAPGWVDFFKWATAAYLISRGIAKASRVLER